MTLIQNIKELIKEGYRQEQAKDWKAAANVYQDILEKDPRNRAVVKRLLMAYRHLKDVRNEFLTIEEALAARAEKDQSEQGKWLAANPQAAKLGKAILQSLGGPRATAYGTDVFVQQLLKRKDVVKRKMNGLKKSMAKTKAKTTRKGKKRNPDPKYSAERHTAAQVFPSPESVTIKNPAVPVRRQVTEAISEKVYREKVRQSLRKKKKEEASRQRAKRAELIKKKKEEARAKKAKAKELNEMRARVKKATAERLKEQKLLKLTEAKVVKLPSFFVISLKYQVPLKDVYAAMCDHIAYLERYFLRNIFFMAGRQVPRTGGIIIAKVKDRKSIEKIVQQDPFVKKKLASFDIVEFKASKFAKSLW